MCALDHANCCASICPDTAHSVDAIVLIIDSLGVSPAAVACLTSGSSGEDPEEEEAVRDTPTTQARPDDDEEEGGETDDDSSSDSTSAGCSADSSSEEEAYASVEAMAGQELGFEYAVALVSSTTPSCLLRRDCEGVVHEGG